MSPPVDTTTTTTANDESQAAKTRQQNQARRAQVRSAQIRHRQRKANHQRQLELDMTEYQSLIAQIEGETTALRRQNAEMRARLGAAGIMLDDSGNEVAVLTDDDDDDDQSMPSAPGSPPAVPAYLGTGDVYDQDVDQPPELFSSIDVDRLTVTLAMDDTMGSPALQISGSASTSAASSTEAASLLSPDAHNAGTSSAATSPPTEPAPAKYLSPVQEEAAVNFILAYVYPSPLISCVCLLKTLASSTSAGATS